MKKVELHTDGSALGNPGKGGWGFILVFGKHEKEDSGGVKHATNNQMELMAVIKGLEAIKEPCEIDLFSDSKYVLDGLEKWIHNWKVKNWKTAAKKDVANKELWIELDELRDKHTIHFNWVKGHGSNIYNNRVDKLANSAAHNVI
jgi:ribonuclease HI